MGFALLICTVFLTLHFFLTYCIRGSLSPGFRVVFLLPFGFCPWWVRLPVVWVSFVLGGTCACVLVGQGVFFFASDQQGCVRWYVLECLWEACLPVSGTVFGLACYLGEASCTGCCWELGDAGSYRRRPSGEFSLINTLWGQEFSGSLVSWTQHFHSKGSGQISSQVTKIPQSTC